MTQKDFQTSSVLSALYDISEINPEQLVQAHSHRIRLPDDKPKIAVDTFQDLFRDACSINEVFAANHIEDIVPKPANVVRPALARTLRALGLLYPPEPYPIPKFWQTRDRWYQDTPPENVISIIPAFLYASIIFTDIDPQIEKDTFQLIPTPERTKEQQEDFIRHYAGPISLLLNLTLEHTNPKINAYIQDINRTATDNFALISGN